MPVLVDTGVLYALADQDDDWHERAVTFFDITRDLLLVPVTVIPEVTYLLKARLGDRAERSFVAALAAGELDVEPVTTADLKRCDGILDRWPALGFVDASVVAMAERLKVTTVATTDRRHFGQVRPAHATRFRLVP
jgi:predicted nucleic acid-binding protein